MTIDPRIIEQFNLLAPFRLQDATVLVLARVGSQSHNTYVPKDDPNAIDDVDYMGIVIPPPSFTLGIKSWENTAFQFEELDCVFYSFRKYMHLTTKVNPNVLGLMFQREEDYIVQSPEWEIVRSCRQIFASRRAYPAFTGYAYSQLKRMTAFDIKTQNQWDSAIALIEAAGWTKDQIVDKRHRDMPNMDAVLTHLYGGVVRADAEDAQPFVENATHRLDAAAKTIITIHAAHFQGYMGEKRKNLVRKYGYDTKNAAHLIRLLRMCNEYLFSNGGLQVYRIHDAQEIRDIKSGKWTLDEVKAHAEELFKKAEELLATTTLPEDPDEERIDALSILIYRSAYRYI